MNASSPVPRRAIAARRSYECNFETEDPDDYSRGIYFPVELGDHSKDGRYRVLHELRWGACATV